MRLQDLKPLIINKRQAKHRKDGFPAMPWHLSGIRPELLSLTRESEYSCLASSTC